MATYRQFEDLEIWQKARIFAARIHSLTIQGSFERDFKLRDQISGSSGSIMDNIAEGFERGGNKEFVQFLSFAKGSSGETRSQLYRALDRNHISKESFDELYEESMQLSKQISGFMKYLNSSDFKGPKFIREPGEDYAQGGNLKF